MSKRDALTVERLRELLIYDKDSGEFVRRTSTAPNARAGDVAGTNSNGYIVIGIDGVLHAAHRLAWMYVTGDWPAGEVDHKDGRKSNNRWDNLRDVSHQTNARHQLRPSKRNRAGFLGATWIASRNKWRAQVTVNRKTIFVGQFDTAQEAHTAYLAAKAKLHPDTAI
jgi:hypothetical protein